MRRFLPSARRLLVTIAGASAVGITAALALAAPASACNVFLKGTPDCVNDTTGKVVWTITNDHPGKAEILQVTATGADLQGDIKQGAFVPAAKNGQNGTLTATQTTTLKSSVSINIKVRWADNKKEATVSDQKTLNLKCGGEVSDEKYSAESTSDCYNLTIKVTNGSRTPKTFAVKDSAGKQLVEKLVPANSTLPLPAIKATALLPDKKFTVVVKKPGSEDSIGTGAWVKPNNCDTPSSGVAGASSNAGSGTLPVTGANTGLLAGAAVLLVGAGVALFFAARRRRVKFTA